MKETTTGGDINPVTRASVVDIPFYENLNAEAPATKADIMRLEVNLLYAWSAQLSLEDIHGLLMVIIFLLASMMGHGWLSTTSSRYLYLFLAIINRFKSKRCKHGSRYNSNCNTG